MKWRWWKTEAEKEQDVADLKEQIILQLKDDADKEKLRLKEEREKEPWVDIKGMVEDPKYGIKVDLDWNEAFIEYLRDNGITGVDEEIIVQKWITMLYRDLMEQGQNEDGSDRGLE